MIRYSTAVVLIAVCIVLTIGVTCRDPYARILHYRAARWGDYAAVLERDVGPLEYMGGVHLNRGGCDVWRAENGDWWLIGPGRRFSRCTPDTALTTGDRVIREAVRDIDAAE